jgi:uncharacterized membrane protein YoaK (UPF0700 family)
VTFLLFLIWLGAIYYRQGGAEAAWQGTIFVVLIFLCVLLHELGHVFAARRYGVNTRDVTLWPFGGIASMEQMPEKPAQELVVALSFLGLGKIFTAFMTGNIAFLGMGIAGYPGAPRIVWVLASMAGFAAGVYLATKIVKPSIQSAAHEGEQTTAVVWPRETTFALGISLLAHLCFVAIWLATGGQPDDNLIRILLAVWALAMGNQSAAVRQLNVGGIFTTAATATVIFLTLPGGNTGTKRTTSSARRGGLPTCDAAAGVS